MDGQVRTRRDSEWATGTYLLESMHGQTSQDAERIQVGEGEGWRAQMDGWTSQDVERIQVSEGHSQLVQCTLQTCFDLAWCRPIEIRMRKRSRQGALTFANTDGQVRTWKERV